MNGLLLVIGIIVHLFVGMVHKQEQFYANIMDKQLITNIVLILNQQPIKCVRVKNLVTIGQLMLGLRYNNIDYINNKLLLLLLLQCSSDCGVGISTRLVTCKHIDGYNVIEQYCNTVVKPNVTQMCNVSDCPEWKHSNWTQVY